MPVTKSESIALRTDADVVKTRQVTRAWSEQLRFSLIDQTKLVTACSEIARNTILHGGGGTATLEIIEETKRRGLRLTFVDRGPGIADIELAMRDGYTTGSGLGLGLGGAKRLVNEFRIDSAPGQGTRVVLARWR